MCVWGGGVVSILMDDIIPHIRHYLILQSSQHDSHNAVSGIPPTLSQSFSLFLSSSVLLSLFLSLSPSHLPLSCCDSVFLQTMLFTAGLSPSVVACYRRLLPTGTMARANQMGVACSNHRAECIVRHSLSQSELLVARHPEVKGEGR